MTDIKKFNFDYLSVAEIRFTTEVDLAGIIPKGCEFFSKANYGNFSVLQNQVDTQQPVNQRHQIRGAGEFD